jgi:hypothetical protein
MDDAELARMWQEKYDNDEPSPEPQMINSTMFDNENPYQK